MNPNSPAKAANRAHTTFSRVGAALARLCVAVQLAHARYTERHIASRLGELNENYQFYQQQLRADRWQARLAARRLKRLHKQPSSEEA